jgi:hypothetical protein
MNWELACAKSYHMHGHGIECAIDMIDPLGDSLKMFSKVVKLKGKESCQLLNWDSVADKPNTGLNTSESLYNHDWWSQ